MTESTNPKTPPPPSGDGSHPIDLEAVSALLEGEGLVTESELRALAESRGQHAGAER
jgi:hypothetical protein